MIKKNLNLIILGLIIIFAGFLYCFKLNNIPSGIYVDEAVAAYDSYSLINTGADHFGKKFPIAFRFFGAYTPGLFVYINTLPIKIFGLNNFSIRFISVISTLIQLIFLYLITKFFTKDKSKYLRPLTIFLISFIPWMVFNARLGYEVTLAQTLITVAVYFLLASTKNPKLLIISSLFFSLSVYTAHTQKILAPLIIIFSFFLFKIWRYPKKIVLTSFLILLITQIPNFYLITTNSFWVKTSSINKNNTSLLSDLNYQLFQTISPKTWFNQSPDIDLQHQIPEISLFYSWMFLPIFIGLIKVFWKKKKPIEFNFIIGFLLISLIPGILSGRFMSTQRLISLLIPFSVFLFLGIDQLIKLIKNKIILFLIFISLIFYSLIMLWRSYFILLPNIYASSWNYGADQVVQYVKSNPDKHFIVDNTRNPRQYILFLYYLKYNPQKFHQEIGNFWSKDYYQNTNYISNISFSNLEFRPISDDDFKNTNNIIVADDLTISNSDIENKGLKIINKIYFPNQKPAYIFYQKNNIKP